MTRINHWKQLVDELSKFKNTPTLHPNFLFRGQASSKWTLEPSFTRIAKKKGLSRAQVLQLEREAVNKFSISASKLLPLEYTIDLTLSRFKSSDGKGLDFLGWFVVIQHYFAPTRQLDWSVSPWAALYFACCEEDELDGMLWVGDFNKVTEYGNQKLSSLGSEFVALITDPTSPDILMFSNAFNTNQRVEAQQGKFSICTNPLTDHLPMLEDAQAISKLEIPKELKPIVMVELDQMNISAKTLFPGVDGLGRSITVYCNQWDKSSKIT